MDDTYSVFRGSSQRRIVADTLTYRALNDNEVFIETTHSGLCGTDEHYLKENQVLGHEGIGIVRNIGRSVTSVKVGAPVGFGYTHKVCGNCNNCTTGWDQYCQARKQYGMNDFDNGTFGHGAIWDADSVHPIPEGYESTHAAPLICAGATVWTILNEYGVRSTDRVAIMGVEGLGHLAIQLAAAMGCHVIVLTSSESSRQEALGFGASESHIFRSKDQAVMTHLILLMATHGTIYPLTVSFEPAQIPLLDLLDKGIRVQGSLVASRHTIRSLLEFAARKEIVPRVMTFPLTIPGIERAMQTLRDGKMRYRGVLVRENMG